MNKDPCFYRNSTPLEYISTYLTPTSWPGHLKRYLKYNSQVKLDGSPYKSKYHAVQFQRHEHVYNHHNNSQYIVEVGNINQAVEVHQCIEWSHLAQIVDPVHCCVNWCGTGGHLCVDWIQGVHCLYISVKSRSHKIGI